MGGGSPTVHLFVCLFGCEAILVKPHNFSPTGAMNWNDGLGNGFEYVVGWGSGLKWWAGEMNRAVNRSGTGAADQAVNTTA